MNNKTIQSKLHCGKDIVIKFKNMDDLDPLNFVDDQKNDRPQTKTNKYIEREVIYLYFDKHNIPLY